MEQLTDRISQFKDRIVDLNKRVVKFVDASLEPSIVSRVKQRFTDGTAVPLTLIDENEAITHGLIKIKVDDKKVSTTFAIDLILEHNVNQLSWYINNVNLRVDPTDVIGVMYTENGTIRVIKMHVCVKNGRYHLSTQQLNQGVPGRYFIMFDLQVSLDNYQNTNVIVGTGSEGEPSEGGGSR